MSRHSVLGTVRRQVDSVGPRSRYPPRRQAAVNHAIAEFEPRSFCGLRSDPDPVIGVPASGDPGQKAASVSVCTTDEGLTRNLVMKGLGYAYLYLLHPLR